MPYFYLRLIFLSVFFNIICIQFAKAQQNMQRLYAENSVLSQGSWSKIAVIQEGIYKITYADLIQSGIQPPYKSADFRLYGNGGRMLPEYIPLPRFDDLIENSVLINDAGDDYIDDGDFILFFGEGTTAIDYNQTYQILQHKVNLYSDTAYYFFTFDLGAGKRIGILPNITQPPDISKKTFKDLFYYERDLHNFMKTGKLWVGETFDISLDKNFSFIIPDISDSLPVKIRTEVFARSMTKSAFEVNVNNSSIKDSIDPVDGNIHTDYARRKVIYQQFSTSNDTLNFNIQYFKSESSSIGWLNYIEIESFRNLIFRNSQIYFRDYNVSGSSINRYLITKNYPILNVWLIGDSGTVSQIPVICNGNQCYFDAEVASSARFVISGDSGFLKPVMVGKISNQNLHGLPQADYIIIADPEFMDQAETLAQFHRNNDFFKVHVVNVKQLYNEFSSGKQDPAAIRDFARMFHKRAEADSVNKLKYLLLFGDGSYDMKNRIEGNTNYIPTWQTESSLTPITSYVSDDFFGMLDDFEGDNLNGDLDVGVGRFPVSNSIEATILVNKSIQYGTHKDLTENFAASGMVSNFDVWRNKICFVADDEDANLHFIQTEKMTFLVDSLTRQYSINKLYLDAYKQVHTPSGDKYPSVNNDIDKSVSDGVMILNYVGHGGEYGLASENILTFSEIGKYHNKYNLPVFITATCEFSRYDNPQLVSAGEKILLHPEGGGIAMFSTTRIAFAHSNEIVNRNLLKSIFNETINDVRFGDLIKNSKNLCGFGVYKQNFTLLGDPALTLAIPKFKIITQEILHDTTVSSSDTIYNNTIVTVNGYLADNQGNKLDWFNGKLYPEIYDKPVLCTTLGNDQGASFPAPFYLQQQRIYKGNININQGDFSFSFFVPRDISFSEGMGRILYYAKNPEFDAHGVYDSLNIKNSGEISNSDFLGPLINTYFDDTLFVDGGYTGTSPLLIVHLSDISGINAYNIGIGHELKFELDGDVNNPVYLNEFFTQDEDSYRSGKIFYQLNGLEYGEHVLKIIAWDLLNNKSEQEIRFFVKNPSKLSLDKIYNYPEPVYDHTWFHIETNLSEEIMHLNIVIYDITGKKCHEINKKINPGTFKPIEIFWGINNDNGELLNKGLYTYTVTLSEKSGKLRQKSDKLIIIK